MSIHVVGFSNWVVAEFSCFMCGEKLKTGQTAIRQEGGGKVGAQPRVFLHYDCGVKFMLKISRDLYQISLHNDSKHHREHKK